MSMCKNCMFYEPTDDENGKCFGHEVPAERPSDECPKMAFKPKE